MEEKWKDVTIQDLSTCANNLIKRYNGEDTHYNLKSKTRKLKEVLLFRYAFYKACRSSVQIETTWLKNKETRIRFSLKEVCEATDMKTHSNVLNGINAFNNLISQKDKSAIEIWAAMEKEVNDLLIRKELSNDKTAKRVLIGGI